MFELFMFELFMGCGRYKSLKEKGPPMGRPFASLPFAAYSAAGKAAGSALASALTAASFSRSARMS